MRLSSLNLKQKPSVIYEPVGIAVADGKDKEDQDSDYGSDWFSDLDEGEEV